MNSQFIRSIFIDWDKISPYSYLRRIESIASLETLEFPSPVTFFVGENGSGKSTMLEAIAIASGFNPEGGTRNYSFSTYDSHSELCGALNLSRGYRRARGGYFLRAESFYNVATMEEQYADLDHPSERYHEKSHGESFLALAQKQLRPEGLYFLDEPEAALSPYRQLTLLMELDRCARQNSQFFIVTHSPILLGIPGAQILDFGQGPVHPCSYEETDSYQVMEMFINNREQMLKHLLGDQEAIMPPEDHERIRRNQNS
ncbi:MAG: AAA family ATPase [Lachnospiraceae bacterium]|nr:AAA family ATPase [Lachnospiraceae bacterium]